MRTFQANRNSVVGVSHTLEGLSLIHDEGCAAAICQRDPLPEFQTWIDNLDPRCLPKARLILPHDHVHDAINQVCDICGTPDCRERRLLVDDASALAAVFGGIVPASYIQLRLEVEDAYNCQAFDIDLVKARLVCTYRGKGTQLGLATNGEEPRQVFTVPTGAPVLFRGALWPQKPKPSLSHRSPPIETLGETRLLLVLDLVDELGHRPARGAMH
ncbi:MAG: DUF1826 domain-containing protein [Pseudomonadota bacterium]